MTDVVVFESIIVLLIILLIFEALNTQRKEKNKENTFNPLAARQIEIKD